jgi:hypothetical protein
LLYPLIVVVSLIRIEREEKLIVVHRFYHFPFLLEEIFLYFNHFSLSFISLCLKFGPPYFLKIPRSFCVARFLLIRRSSTDGAQSVRRAIFGRGLITIISCEITAVRGAHFYHLGASVCESRVQD